MKNFVELYTLMLFITICHSMSFSDQRERMPLNVIFSPLLQKIKNNF